MKRNQENEHGNIGGVLVGALIGFAVGLFLKEEDRKKIVNFLGAKTKIVANEGKTLIQNTVAKNILAEKEEKLPARKRLFSKRK